MSDSAPKDPFTGPFKIMEPSGDCRPKKGHTMIVSLQGDPRHWRYRDAMIALGILKKSDFVAHWEIREK